MSLAGPVKPSLGRLYSAEAPAALGQTATPPQPAAVAAAGAGKPARESRESYVPRSLAEKNLKDYEHYTEYTRDAHVEQLRKLEERFSQVQAASKQHYLDYIEEVRKAARERLEAQDRELIAQRKAAALRLRELRTAKDEELRALRQHAEAERVAAEERAAAELEAERAASAKKKAEDERRIKAVELTRAAQEAAFTAYVPSRARFHFASRNVADGAIAFLISFRITPRRICEHKSHTRSPAR